MKFAVIVAPGEIEDPEHVFADRHPAVELARDPLVVYQHEIEFDASVAEACKFIDHLKNVQYTVHHAAVILIAPITGSVLSTVNVFTLNGVLVFAAISLTVIVQLL